MNKNFTKEDIIKKHQTNVKSAQSAFVLAGMLGIIYIVRYFITGNFDFYFSLSFTQVWLSKVADGTAAADLGYTLSAIFIAIYFALCVVIAKKPLHLPKALSLYILDFAALIYSLITSTAFSSDSLIDVILHLFITVFLIAGIKSEKALRKE